MLRQLETPDALPEEQLGAALAYLEVTWLEAARHAAETDAAFAALADTARGRRRGAALQGPPLPRGGALPARGRASDTSPG